MFFCDATRRFRSLRDGFVLRGLGNKRENERKKERERERENGVDRRLFAADCVPTEEERETPTYKIVIAQNLRHTKERDNNNNKKPRT